MVAMIGPRIVDKEALLTASTRHSFWDGWELAVTTSDKTDYYFFGWRESSKHKRVNAEAWAKVIGEWQSN